MGRISLLLLMFFAYSAVDAQELGSTKQEFEIKKEQQKQRYQDYYIRENQAERAERERQAASGAHKLSREKVREDYEQARKDFIANRKAKKILSDEEHLKELEAQKKAHERSRKEYTRRRDELERIEASTAVIPEWIEYKLYEPYETSDTKD